MAAEPSDDALLRRMAAGDEESFTTLYRRHQAAIYRFALHMSGTPAIAEDVTQEVFLNLIRRPNGYDGRRGALLSYLYGMARNLVLRSLASRPGVPLDTGDRPAAGDLFEDLTRRQLAAAVRRAVLRLPPRYREVVVLCDLEEMDYAEAAQVLGCAVGTVRSRLHRARALLAGKLRPRQGREHELSGV